MNWPNDSSVSEKSGGTRPITAVSKGLRAAKVWRRIEALEMSLGLTEAQNAEKEIIDQILRSLSPEDLLL
jgi:hypothetical protein